MDHYPFVLILTVGIVVGVLNGLFGVGGGTLLVPLLIFWFRHEGLPMEETSIQAISLSLASMIPVSLFSFFNHRRRGIGSFREVFWLFLGGGIGALLAAQLALLLKGAILVLAFAGLELYMGFSLLRNSKESTVHPRSSFPQAFKLSGTLPWILVGFLAGGLSSLFGIGGGIVAVPLQVFLLEKPIHSAIANSTGLISLTACVGTLRYFLSGFIPWGEAILILPVLLALGALLGSPLGVRLAHRLPGLKLRRLYGGFLLLVALLLIGETLRSPTSPPK